MAAVGASLIAALLPVSNPATGAAAPIWVTSTTTAADSMSRAVATGWGSATTGGAYSVEAGSSYSITEGFGRMNMPKGGASASARLRSTSVGDVVSKADFAFGSVPTTGSGFYAGVRVRSTDPSNYLAQARLTTSGAVRISLVRVNTDGTTARLGSEVDPKVKLTKNQWASIELQATGTTMVSLSARVWVRGTTVPSWQVSATDTAIQRIQKAGYVSLWSYTSSKSGGTITSFDNFSAKSLVQQATAPPAPAPVPDSEEPAPAPVTVGAGSAPIGQTSYGIPSGAVFVATSGSDSAAGTQAAPLKTLSAAIKKAPSGSTIVIRGGSYHERTLVPTGKKLTIQSYPKEAVWFDGSTVVTGFAKSGTTWLKTGWTTKFDSSPTFARGAPDSQVKNWTFVNPAYPMAAHPDQVWINGAAQTQVQSLAQVTAGKFYVDYPGSRLYLGTDPTGKTVQASNLQIAMQIVGSGTTVRGIGFRRYAPSVPDMGSVTINQTNVTLENVTITDMSTIGVSVMASGATLRNLTVLRNGLLGVHGNHADGVSIINSLVDGNNTERFNNSPVSGGIKITRTRGVTVRGTKVSNNLSTGLWLDESTYNMNLIGNDVVNNYWFGIVLEISAKAVIANNLSANNGNDGIRLVNVSDVKIWNNTSVKNLRDINITQDYRKASDLSIAGHDPRQPFPDPTMTWIVNNVQVMNNVMSNTNASGDALFGVQDKNKVKSGAQMGVTSNGNIFNRTSATAPTNAIVWAKAGTYGVAYKSLTDYRAATGQDGASRGIDGSSVMANASQVTAATTALAPTVGQSLPADVATLVGKASGTKALGAWR